LRLTLFIALVIGAILLALGSTLYFLSRSVLLSGVEDTARTRATAAAGKIEAGKELSDAFVGQLTLDGVALIVRNENGGVLRTVNPPPHARPEKVLWREAQSSGEPASGIATLSGDDPYFVYAVPVDPPAGTARVVEAANPYESAQDALEVFRTVLAVGTGAAFLLSIGGAYFLAGATLRPVDAVTSAAREMGEGDLSRRLPVANPKDEVGRLATTINKLLAHLEAAFARREEALSRQRRFAADASHELRTPLTSISGHARMLDEWALERDTETARRSVRAIRREANRMRDLVESLLTLTRGDEGAPLEVGRHYLGEVAREAVESAKDAGSKVSIELVPPENEVGATFDRGRVLQVASILLDNAVKYTPAGGTVTVRVEEKEDTVNLSIADTGAGIPRDQLPLVFERFYRTDAGRAEHGTGLGLSIARQIAESHGGAVTAKSTVGVGSEFTLRLPRPRPGPDSHPG